MRGSAVRGWSEKIRKAQKATTIRIQGVAMSRVRYGREKQDWEAESNPCHDCRIKKGQIHVAGCDVEECPKCHGQLIGCDCRSKPRKVKPFSPREMQIVSARRNFKWRHVGFARNGDARFEVINNSSMQLAYLSVGVQGRGGTKLVGGVWLDVSKIPPGGRGTVQMDCYKDMLSRNETECFEEPDPTPETRDRYWEFKRQVKPK